MDNRWNSRPRGDGYYENNDRWQRGRDRTQGYGEYDYRNEGSFGRNASDFESRRYSEDYYYTPGDDRYDYTNDYDRDYKESWDPASGRNGGRHDDYFRMGDDNYYGSYPSYGQSYINDDRRERYHSGSYQREGNYYPQRGIGREPIYNRRPDESDDGRSQGSRYW